MTADWEQYMELEKTMAHYCRALGHPARVAILRAIVVQGNLVEGEIVDVPQLSRNTVIQHLRELKRSGLLIGRIFGAKAHYQINPEALRAFKHFSDSFFKGMDELLNSDELG